MLFKLLFLSYIAFFFFLCLVWFGLALLCFVFRMLSMVLVFFSLVGFVCALYLLLSDCIGALGLVW